MHAQDRFLDLMSKVDAHSKTMGFHVYTLVDPKDDAMLSKALCEFVWGSQWPVRFPQKDTCLHFNHSCHVGRDSLNMVVVFIIPTWSSHTLNQ